ncbi:MAG TPA: hypothetical protein VJU83_01365 [Burkholderiales bacterium]|nr:hypothetical protein [Burkholderiales bacterium]
MSVIEASPLPTQALIAKYAGAGAYTDCYATELPYAVSHAEYIEAFYTGSLFKLERLLLSVFLAKPSTDAQARQLAAGEISNFSAWRVEARTANQLLMCDLGGRTRSWLMVLPVSQPLSCTRLYFGSVVVPVINKSTGESRMGFPFRLLIGFHKLYSRALLAAARSRLMRAVY